MYIGHRKGGNRFVEEIADRDNQDRETYQGRKQKQHQGEEGVHYGNKSERMRRTETRIR